jgi:hypothetical protein
MSRLLDINENVSEDYVELTPLDWVKYEFETIEYDYKIHPEAANRIRSLFEQLFKEEVK